jgi:hypothetical protein
VHGPDPTALDAGLAERPPGVAHHARESRVADDAFGPELRNQLLLGHHAVAVLEEEGDDLEDQRLEGNSLSHATELVTLGRQLEVAEAKGHGGSSGGGL